MFDLTSTWKDTLWSRQRSGVRPPMRSVPPLFFALFLVAAEPSGALPGRSGNPGVQAQEVVQFSPDTLNLPLRLGLQRRNLPFPIRFSALPTLPLSMREDPGELPSAGLLGEGLPFDPFLVFQPGPGAGTGTEQEEPASLFQSELADVSVVLRGRGELGGDWTRFQPCEVGLQVSCEPSLFPQMEPDIQFGLQVNGTVANRIHVDVDYDQTREFSAVNNVNLYYEGDEGSILRRAEVGDVTLNFPESRFLTQGIPAGNFGFRAVTDLGPLDIQTVWAQQNGDISSRDFQLSGVGGRQAFIQEDTLTLDDADFVSGQFFFLTDPRGLLDYPHVDVLGLDPGAASPSVAPGAEPIQLYRFENDPVTRQQVEGYIQAEAVAERDGQTVTESGWFRYLQPGVDYLLHPSGLWVALRRPLRKEEMLAVTYVTASGDTIGDYNPEAIHNQGGRPMLRLLKASGPKHQPGTPTWEMEMHQIYRISSSDDVESSSVALTLSLGELSGGRTFKRRPTGEEITLLKLLGLDEESPTDELDPNFILRPAQDFFQERPPVTGTFIVFPTLRPFAEPPPVSSLGLTAEETREILGADANDRIYDAVDPVERESGGVYRLTIPFRIRSEGLISSFSLGALGIRDGSERIRFGENTLLAGEDYLIDYDIGQVTLLNPEALFAANPDARIRASWEQKALFQIAPTSIFGFNARYGLGDRGALHLLGLYQKEQSLQNRPQLGMEPASIFLGGINGDFSFGAGWLDRAANWLSDVGGDAPASLDVRGEMALSLPNPNTKGDVYLDDFDAANGLGLSLRARDWHLGSAPEEGDGLGGDLPPSLSAENVLGLVWQDTWILQGLGGDSLGIFEGYFPSRDIDEQIRIAGTEIREPGLRLSFGGDSGGGPAPVETGWRSVTSVLSNTGRDLTRSDFLEFYASGEENLTLILDLGRVSEDALFLDGNGNSSGSRPGAGEPWGLGYLDQEADPRKGEIWNSHLDEAGVWVENCQSSPGRIYPLGDPQANCTRSNGRNDTEDLDGDGNLLTEDRVYRYVVRLNGNSPYLVRTTEETGTSFQLYRIPLRGPDALNVGGRVTEADWRAVKHLRLTVVGNAGDRGVSLTRLRLLGSRWVKRGVEGVLAGIGGEIYGTGGKVEVGPVSRLSEGPDYTPPPGVLEEVDDPSQAYGGGGVEFNESSLAIKVGGLGPGERAEVYSRFPQRPRNFLTYRQLRVWVLGREGDWGEVGGDFFLKVGTDSENFYLYKTKRPEAPSAGGVGEGDWLPEVVVDFDRWLALRVKAEEELILNPPAQGGPPLEVWSADSTYAVVLKDRVRAPNLAAVREISLGLWNPGMVPIDGTVWVNELRLAGPLQEGGYAGYLDMDLESEGLFRTSLRYSGQGPFFRQLSGDPTFQDDASLSLYSTLELGRVAPETWGVSIPVTFSHTDFSQDPTFLAQSDVRVDEVQNLRKTGHRETRVEVGLQKTTPTGNRILDPVLQGLSLRAGYSRTEVSTTTLESNGSGLDARAEYLMDIDPREVALIPGFAQGVIRAILPGFWEESILGSRLRWTPDRIRMGTLFTRRDREAYRFEQILALPADSTVTPTLSPVEALETTAQIDLRPLQSVSAQLTFFSVRDLLLPEEAIQDSMLHPVLEQERARLGGLDLGWETNRTLRSRFGFGPSLASWLRTDFSVTTDYSSDRSAALADLLVVGQDTMVVLQRNANGNRTTRASFSLDPRALATSLGPSPPGEAVDDPGALNRILNAIDPISLTRQGGLSSRFFRESVDPNRGFQLGWGDWAAMRILDGDTASIFTGQTSWSGGTGIRLPFNLRVSGNYSESTTEILYARSDRELRTRTWPDVRVTLARVSLPESAKRVIESLSFSSGYRENSVVTTFGGRGVQRRFQDEWQIPLEASITWAGAVSTRYRGSFSEGDGGDPTGSTRTRRDTHSFLLSSTVSDPPFIAEHVDGPLRVSMQYQYSSELNCRELQGRDGCVPFVDFLNRNVNLTLDTVITPLLVGLHLSYIKRSSFVGQRDGSSQFQLGIFGQFHFDSGTFTPPSVAGTSPGF